MEFNSAYSKVHKKQCDCSADDKLTEDAHREFTDVNGIVERFAHGVLPQMREGTYEDLTEVTDFNTMQQTVARVKTQFEILPAKIRDKFDNDPSKYVNFINTATEDEIKATGLVKVEKIDDSEPKKKPPEKKEAKKEENPPKE